ncbi:MAG: carotenoid oxygenase family protein [Solirubrobacteraceae bacterium]|nr:carotenoid oxygenase family protein [Solirubrobacteraceae bacterium]
MPGTQTHASRNAAFASVTKELDLDVREIEGEIPEDLTGTLYRNGPARWDGGNYHAGHVFDGDGMLAQFVFSGGELHYRNRFVRTPRYRTISQNGAVRGVGTDRPGGPLANAGRLPADRANTHAVLHADRLLAVSDDGRPWELDRDTLETLGRYSYGGALSPLSLFSPHPRIDPVTGEMFNFGLAPVLRPRPRIPAGLRCYRISPSGRMDRLASVPLDHVHINHDFTITDRHLVFVLAPIVVEPIKAIQAMLGLRTIESATEYRPELGTKVILVPRDGSKPRTVECPGFAYVHLNNAYEDRGDVVIDLMRYDGWDAISGAVRDFRTTDQLTIGAKLTRVRVTSTDRVVLEDLSDLRGEFPQHDWRRTGRAHRHGWFVGALPGDAPIPALIGVDHASETQEHYEFAAQDMPGEPLFVPRHDDASENDGWIVNVVYLGDEHRSSLQIFDARNLPAGPVAVARLPHHTFPGFHGSFTTRVARPTG